MRLSENAVKTLTSMGQELGLAWHSNARKTRGSDQILNICIGDGIIPTKIDGWIHACTLTAKSMVKYAADPQAGLDIVGVTSWSGGNAALRYARWQADFHWKIDTRVWQFFLYMFPMKWAFRDAITKSAALDEDERRTLLKLNEDFWEEVVVAYAYRSEVIERARRFAPHPDPTCGASWQGYPYRAIWDRDDVSFDDLAMPFIEKGKVDYEAAAGKVEPKPFPALDNQVEPGLPSIAWGWVQEAKRRGLCDDWLRVRLGERWVPTRFNGWSASLEETMRFLERFAAGARAAVDGACTDEHGHDLADYAVRFALCQAEFQRRLEGEVGQLTGLLETQGPALKEMLAEAGRDGAAVDAFVERAASVIRNVLASSLSVDDGSLPELHVVRPLHPRYAPPDPLEPLHWEVPNPAGYRKKMAKLGYTL